MNEYNLTVDLYTVEAISSAENSDKGWLWDFGVFTCRGTESYPSRPVKYGAYQAAANEIDAEDIHNRTPCKRESLTVYEFDYSLFVEVPMSNAEYVIKYDSLYEIGDSISRGLLDSENVDSSRNEVVLQQTARPGNSGEKYIVTEKELHDAVEDGELIPLTKIQN